MINQLLKKETVVINHSHQNNPLRSNLFTIVPKTNRGRNMINTNIIQSFVLNDSLISQPMQPADTVLGVLNGNASAGNFQVIFFGFRFWRFSIHFSMVTQCSFIRCFYYLYRSPAGLAILISNIGSSIDSLITFYHTANISLISLYSPDPPLQILSLG